MKYLNEPENHNEFLIRSIPNKKAPPITKKSQPKKSNNISAYDNSKVDFKTGKTITPSSGPKKMKSMNSPSTKSNKTLKAPKSSKPSKNSKPTDLWWNGVQEKEEPHHLYHNKQKPQKSLKELAMKPAPVRSKNKVCYIHYVRF